MSDYETKDQISELKAKLQQMETEAAALGEKSARLESQNEDARLREQTSNEIIKQLLERQRELNVMLNRANIMLHRTQEALALTHSEFQDATKSLPEPKKAELNEKISKIQDLFSKTGVQDAEVSSVSDVREMKPDADEFDSGEIAPAQSEKFELSEDVWTRTEVPEPPEVDAEEVEYPESGYENDAEADGDGEFTSEPVAIGASDGKTYEEIAEEALKLIFPPRRKSWWRRVSKN